MAFSDHPMYISLVAGEALTRGRIAQFSAGTAIEANNATTAPIGIVGESVDSGDEVPIMSFSGAVHEVELGATLAAGAEVMSNGSGQAIALAGVDVIGAGILLEGGDSGEIVAMLYQPKRGVSA